MKATVEVEIDDKYAYVWDENKLMAVLTMEHALKRLLVRCVPPDEFYEIQGGTRLDIPS